MNREHFQTRIDRMERRREGIRKAAETMLLGAQEQRGAASPLTAAEDAKLAAMQRDLAETDDELRYLTEERDRCGHVPENLQRAAMRNGPVSSAGRLAPLGYGDEQLRRAFGQVGRGETAVMESRDFSTATGLIPPDLGPVLPVFPRHETRLLEKLPGIAIDVPALAYVEVTASTGNAAIAAEGAAKPEILIPAVQKVATARKVAAHTGVSWEAYSGDYLAFVDAVQGELMGKLTDAENQQLYAGTGESNNQVNGLTTNPNVLKLDGALSTGQPGPWDAIEQGIELLRSGPALAEPDLALCHPGTWSAIRRVVDLQGRYYVAPDPSTAEVNTAWGVPVLVSTQFTAGEFTLVDTTRYGRVVVRESLVTRIGYSGTDFTQNIIRFVSEERLTQTIERPQAICVISGLPTAAVAETKSSKSSK